jgi:hypothetical protein
MATSLLDTIHGCCGCFLHDHFTDTADHDSWRVDPAKAGAGVSLWLTTCSRGVR